MIKNKDGAAALRLAMLFATSALSFSLLTSVAAQAQAQTKITTFDIPAQSLGSALAAFSQAAGVDVVYGAALPSVASPGVKGELSSAEALSRLLTGTGLTYRFTSANSVTLSPAPTTGRAIQLGAVRIEGAQGEGQAAAPPPSSDPGATEGSRSYAARIASTSTKLQLSPRETPQSITVVTRQQIEDRNFITMDEALETATGVTGSVAANFGQVNFISRGFNLGFQVDGVPTIGGSTGGYTPNLAIFDRVEIQRGASGLVSGRGDPGGVANLVRKRPRAQPSLDVVLNAGSWNYRRAEVDVSTTLREGARGRLVAAYEDRETFRDGESNKRPLLYAIVEADLTPDTVLTVGGSYEESKLDGFVPYGLPRYSDGRDLKLPRSSRGIAPNWTSGHFEASNLFAGLEHRLTERWTFKAVGEWQRWDQTFVTVDTRGAVNPSTLMGPKYNYLAGRYGEAPETKAFDASMTGEVTAFGRSHQLVFGGFYSDYLYKDATYQEAAVTQVTQTIFDFNPGSIAAPVFPDEAIDTTETSTKQSGVYGVARLNVSDPLKVILGARLSTVKNGYLDRADPSAASSDKESNVFTPYGGLIYDLNDHWSAYASYAEIFQPQATLFTAAGERLAPITGGNYEAGVKGSFHDGALNIAMSTFRMLQTNRSQLDPDNPAPCLGSPAGGDCYIAEGKVRAQGFEAEVSGQLRPGWEVIASYAYTNTQYRRDRTATGAASANQGKTFSTTTPDHVARIWSTYALGDWSFGGGVNYQSEVYRNDGIYRISQGAYALVNLRLGYKVDEHWSAAVNVNNLTDKTYYQRLGTLRNGSRYGEPRSVVATLRASF